MEPQAGHKAFLGNSEMKTKVLLGRSNSEGMEPKPNYIFFAKLDQINIKHREKEK